MSLLSHLVKEAGDRTAQMRSYLVVAGCALLIACNVGVFIFLPKILSPLALILSNAITVILIILAIQPISHLLQEAFRSKAHELMEKEKAEQELADKVRDLENENRELQSKLDTWGQMAAAPATVNFSVKLETMTYEKKGYLVKEEPVERLIQDPLFKPADPQGLMERFEKWKDDRSHTGEKTILYIGKQYAKRALGIDFSKIKFAVDGETIALYGASITEIHNLVPDKDKGDIEHCWVLNNDPKDKKTTVVSINTAEHYSDLPMLYAELCQQHALAEVDEEVGQTCRRYTELFRSYLSDHFPGIVFCDSLADRPVWHPLNESFQNTQVARIAAGMFLVANLLQRFNDIPQQQLPE